MKHRRSFLVGASRAPRRRFDGRGNARRVRDGGEEHLDADGELLQPRGDVRGVVIRPRLFDDDDLILDGEEDGLALPEGDEHDGFDGEKLVKRADGRELLERRAVEQNQAVHRPRLRDVVDEGEVREGDPKVGDLPVAVHPVGLGGEGERGGERPSDDVRNDAVATQTEEGSPIFGMSRNAEMGHT